MNEKLRQLAEQAGMVHGGYANGTKIMTWRESFDNPGSLEKFAEMIVRECLDILDRNNPRPPGTVILYSMDQDQHFDTGWQVAVETKQARIKQHFGVEE